jgi:hypothetical protein
VRKLGGRERCGGDAHVAGEEEAQRAATCVEIKGRGEWQAGAGGS